MRIKNAHEFEVMFGRQPKTPALKQLADQLKKDSQVAKRKRPSKKNVVCLGSLPPFTALPPQDPADRLIHHLIRTWGRFYNGGEVVWELEALSGSGIRIDAAFPRYKLAIESDGWQYHGKYLESFKKDRRKIIALAENGWLVIPVSREQVFSDLPGLLESIKKVLAHRVRQEPDHIMMLPSGWSRIAPQPEND